MTCASANASRRTVSAASLIAGAALSVVTLGAAVAADVGEDFLRGSLLPSFEAPSYNNWEGFYVGGHIGGTYANTDYTNSLRSLTSTMLRNFAIADDVANLVTLGREATGKTSFGGFIGYNFRQWDEFVLGVEANYTRLNLQSSNADSPPGVRIQNDTGAPTGHHFYYDTTLTGSASVKIVDFATLRARAAWSGAGQFLPYAFVGAALGRASYSRTTTVSFTRRDIPDTAIPPITPLPDSSFGPRTETESQSNVLAYGFTAGLGVDVTILPNMFLRAEWEYVQFAPIHDIKVSINTGRVGLGIKF